MYWLFDPSTTTSTDPFDSTGGLPKGFTFGIELENALIKAFNVSRIENFFLTLENDAKKLNTQIANGVASNLGQIQSTIFNVYKEGLKYGFAYGDAKELVEAIGTGMGRITTYQQEAIKDSILLAKSLGMGSKETGEMVSNMMKLGLGHEKANEIILKTYEKAKAFGVNASVLTKTVSTNLYAAQSYNFKDGVDGLTKMAIQAQRLGMDMDKTLNLTLDLLDPEKAMEMSSQFQMMGGEFGKLLGDPFKLMNMDAAELQDNIAKAAAASAEFNTKTGQFEIKNRAMMQYFKETGSQLGYTYKEMSEMVNKAGREAMILDSIKPDVLGGLTEEQKSVVQSLAQIKNGKVMIDIDGNGTLTEINKATLSDLKNLQASQAEGNKGFAGLGDNATQQLSVQQKMLITLEQIRNSGIFGVGLGGGGKMLGNIEEQTILDNEELKKLQTKIQTQIGNISTYIIGYYTAALTSFNTKMIELQNKVVDMATNLKNLMATTNTTSTADTANQVVTGFDVFIPAGGQKTISSGFGDLIKLDKMDASLNIPQADMENLFNYANLGDKASKLLPTAMSVGGKVGSLNEAVEQKIKLESTNTQQVNIAGSTDINIKIDSNLPNDILSKMVDKDTLKDTILTTINDRLSKDWSRKIQNVG